MNRNSYIALFIGLVVVALFFVVSGFNMPFGGTGSPELTGDQSTAASGLNVFGTASNLVTQDVKLGSGEEAVEGKVLTVHYVGALEDGTVFDSSVSRGEPFTFVLGAGQVIAGWDRGLAGMRVGGRRVLSIPPELGYGDQVVGPIPAGSTLLFEVELLDVRDLEDVQAQ